MSIISFCVVILEVEDDSQLIPSLTYKADKKYEEMAGRGKGLPMSLPSGSDRARVRGQRKVRTYEVSTYSVAGSDTAQVPDPGVSQEDGTETGSDSGLELKNFVSGNPFVELTKGVLHLYKDNDRYLLDKSAGSLCGRSEMVCILAVPACLTCIDLLKFIAPCRRGTERIQIIRDSSPNQYMVLLKFTTQANADNFYMEYNGKKFNSFEDDLCLLAYVSHVETLKGSGGAGLPLTGHTELPTCPVCLERMDESVDGLLTILCNHSFHSSCLAKWSDASCPVCRYVQTPEFVNRNVCSECNSSDSLWICLICGNIGCGRYVNGHAYKHFCETQHCYAIQPDNNRVWDYVADKFVHRLLQNKGDGKMVEVPVRQTRSSSEDYSGLEEAEEKVDSVQLEFTYLLTTQLQDQRHYFEERLRQTEADMRARVDFLMSKLELVETDREETETKMLAVQKEKTQLEKKLATATAKLAKNLSEMKEQREMIECYTKDRKGWKELVESLEKKQEKLVETSKAECADLKEQLRDVMFYLEAQAKIQQSPFKEEMRDASVKVDEASVPSTSRTPRRKKR